MDSFTDTDSRRDRFFNQKNEDKQEKRIGLRSADDGDSLSLFPKHGARFGKD